MIVFDTETTGFVRASLSDLKLQPYMTEICAIKIDNSFNFIKEVSTFIKIPVPVPEKITEITGITDKMLENAPTFAEVYDDLANLFLGEEIMVAHNCAFDRDILKYQLMRMGKEFNFPWPKNHICTVEKSRHFKNRRLKLSDLHIMATGKPHENAHRAKNDVHALIRCLFWMINNDHLRIP